MVLFAWMLRFAVGIGAAIAAIGGVAAVARVAGVRLKIKNNAGKLDFRWIVPTLVFASLSGFGIGSAYPIQVVSVRLKVESSTGTIIQPQAGGSSAFRISGKWYGNMVGKRVILLAQRSNPAQTGLYAQPQTITRTDRTWYCEIPIADKNTFYWNSTDIVAVQAFVVPVTFFTGHQDTWLVDSAFDVPFVAHSQLAEISLK
jgi:hypothetical protein